MGLRPQRPRHPAPSGVPDAGRGLRVIRADAYPDWQAIYEDNAVWVYRLMFGKVGNKADAEDLTAEVFVAALGPLRVSASVAEVRTYLRATARTVLAAYWRQRMGRPITTIDDDVREAESAEAGPSDAPARVDAVLDRLPDRYRRILELRFLQGHSVREAAAALGVSVANAKVIQHRALQMAAQLGEEVGDR
ncbi:sigma-70 family RNA polymerase sigma factor [Skermania sp. ID1734]|uniref:RNA polymerase sigma factor n=1 Tax=Skermania sp. ID1734 TaxID=2597516 RepID=UPI00117E2E2F|nr:sigma-70 family RNA polymerase sigma factor [Skermania sp. ID1734]TSE01495.1 sigma-70 family RNA polymerase sigma factor [Skermania sp. ID1734]